METNEILNTIKNVLTNNGVPDLQINNIMELVKIHGEIQFSKGAINELKKQLNNEKK
jgi:hypothetical protein